MGDDVGRRERRKERRRERARERLWRKQKPLRRVAPMRRRMAAWERVVFAGLLLFVLTQLVLWATGRPGFRVPEWLDAPPLSRSIILDRDAPHPGLRPPLSRNDGGRGAWDLTLLLVRQAP